MALKKGELFARTRYLHKKCRDGMFYPINFAVQKWHVFDHILPKHAEFILPPDQVEAVMELLQNRGCYVILYYRKWKDGKRTSVKDPLIIYNKLVENLEEMTETLREGNIEKLTALIFDKNL